MRTRLLNVALLAALVLAVARLWLFLSEPPPALPVPAAGATAPAAGAMDDEQQTDVVDSRPEIYDVIVARDLFSSTRGIVPSAPVAATVSRPQPAPKLTLYGVIMIDEEKAAYLQEGAQEGRLKKVRENESFAGGVVKAIRSDGITFLFAGSEIKVPLRTPKAGAEAPSPRGQAPSGSALRTGTPAGIPRRQMPTGIRPGQLPAPGRPAVAPSLPASVPGTSPAVPPGEPEGELFGDEEFPEGSAPASETPGMTEEEPSE